LVAARRAGVGDVLASGRGITGVAGADIAVVAVDRRRRAIAPIGRRVRDAGIIRTQIAVVAERGAEVETRAGEITVGEVRGQGGSTNGDGLVVVRVAGWSVADLDLLLTGSGGGARHAAGDDNECRERSCHEPFAMSYHCSSSCRFESVVS
jgi:hypothetical protein